MFWIIIIACVATRASGLIAPISHRSRLGKSSLVTVSLGRVSLVGAGPGDPELLTVAALRAISDPEALVVADRLVSKEILELVAGELRVAGKRPGCAEIAQEQIYDWVREAVRENRTVVRLKIGDPFVFGRGGEEVLEFRKSLGIEAHVVPGVSAALAAPLAAGVPVTHRAVAHQLVVTTGYGRNGSHPELPTYHPYQTVVFLMSVGRVRAVARTLIDENGFPEDCPALVVEKASCPEQRIVIGDLTDIADLVDRHEIKPPSTIIFGQSVRVLYEDARHGLVQTPASNDDNILSPFFDIKEDAAIAFAADAAAAAVASTEKTSKNSEPSRSA